MIISAGDLPDRQVLRARVCVVGAGPAGLSLASSLVGDGVDVLLLEAGDPAHPSQELETVRSVGLPYDVAAKRRRGLGGSSRAWNLRTPLGEPYLRLRELDDLDLDARPGVRDTGWPLSKHQLAQAYQDAWSAFGVRAVPRAGERGPAAGPGGRAAAEASAEPVGEPRIFAYAPAATFAEQLPQRMAEDPSVRVVTGAVVTDVRTDEDAGRVSSLRCATRTGHRLVVECEVYVLAGGGIENARLLLASRSRHPEGVGNAHDHVGRYFMEHPHYASGLVRPSDHRLDEEPARWDVHERGGQAVQRKHALSQATVAREGLLSTAFYVVPQKVLSPLLTTRTGDLHPQRTVALHELRAALRRRELAPGGLATLREAVLALPQAGRSVAAQALAEHAVRRGHPRRAAPRTLVVAAMAEQVPNPLSRVRLTGDRDSFGVPVAELDWRLTELDWWSMARSQELLLPYLRTEYGSRVDSLMDLKPRPWLSGGAHHTGTTRMSASPRDGVVDADGRVHGVGNLYVTGTSVFPTGGSANPTLTVVALALRLGTHLRARLATRPAPVAG